MPHLDHRPFTASRAAGQFAPPACAPVLPAAPLTCVAVVSGASQMLVNSAYEGEDYDQFSRWFTVQKQVKTA
jgi:hypothetical protein